MKITREQVGTTIGAIFFIVFMYLIGSLIVEENKLSDKCAVICYKKGWPKSSYWMKKDMCRCKNDHETEIQWMGDKNVK